MNIVALIPARGGSKRIPGKNLKPLAGVPLLAYTIAAAKAVFPCVWVSTEDEAIARYAVQLGAHVIDRPAEFATDDSPDIQWVQHALRVPEIANAYALAILRPTSPFRTAATIRRALEQFRRSEVHSIRAVQPVTEHPGKMWVATGQYREFLIEPLLDQKHPDGTPWHSSPTQSLPMVYLQNASLEIVWTYIVKNTGTISGTKVGAFLTQGYEGYDINTRDDWAMAEAIANNRPELVPS